MISVDCRDARKGIGLGFGVGGREMEDTELEEGEACSYQNNEDYDASIDPDIDLSYLDEKLQDVLGHFQKDFEGGVSLESLGAKFGGYGSFLPSYQRSPVGTHPRTPPKVQKYSTLRSPNNLQLEGGRSNNVVTSSVSQSVGHQPTSTSSTSLPALKAPSVDGLGKQEVSMATACVEDSTPRFDSINKRSTNVADQKTLKVRIKVGTDNLSTRKNTAIYSGLGLDDSPSSSMDDSHSESEGLSQEPENVPFESPTSILEIMTSFPVRGGLLLSPLPDDLIDLIEKEKLLKEARYVPPTRGGLESFDLFVNGSDAVKGGLKMLGEKNMKPVERNDNSAESKCGNNGDSRNGIGGMSKKESDFDSISCEELVSKTLKLPILSNSYSTSCDMIKSRGTNNKGVVKDKVFPDRAEEGPMEPTFTQEDGSGEKRKATFTGKGLKDRKASSLNEIPVHPNKEGQQKGEKTYDIAKSGSNVSKGRKSLNTEIMESSKQKANQKEVLHEQDMRLHPGKELPIPGETKKSKGSHGTSVMEVPKENSNVGSSVVTTIKKGIHTENCTSNSDSENVKLRKDSGRNMDRYKDFFGELEQEEEEENQVDALETTLEDKLKESDVFTKSLSAINNASKEAPGANNKFDKPSTSESYPIMASNLAPRTGNGPISDVAPATGAPVVIKENWVGCDKCQKWRLLPLGTNPNHLPEKWVCSMLNWLPGLNRCSVSEEETTKALVALYQLPAPDSQNNLQNNPGGYFTGATLASFRHPDQTPQNFGLNTVLGSGKKQHATINEGPTQLSSSVKKNSQASVKSRSLNDVNSSPLVAEADLLQLSKSSDLTVEKQKHKYKAKQRVVGPYSDGGDTKSLKMRSRKDSDQDSSRASKKIKTEFKNITDEDWASDHSGAAGKVHPSSSSGFPTSSAGNGRTKYSDHTSSKDSKDSKFDATDRLQDSITKPKVKVEVSLDGGSIEMGNTETRDNAKKRKNKESQNESLPSTRNLQDSMAFVKEEFSENDYRKEKKARTRSEGKESSGSKGHGRTDKKSSHMKNQQLGQDHGSNLSQQSLEGMDSLKRDLGYIQGSLAATSSSSKVSGSHKTKSCFHEVKGSPVESVSSSPMRISNPDKLTSVARDLTVKDDFQNAGHLANGSPKRSYDGEDFGGSDQTRAGKEKASTMAHHGSLECSVRDFHDRDFNLKGSKARNQASSPDITKNQYSVNGAVDNSVQDTQHPSKTLNSDQCGGVERQNDCHYRANGSHSRKSGKGSSSRLKDKNRSSKSDLDMERVKSSDVLNEPHKFSPSCELKPRDGKNKLREKFGDKSDEIENKFLIRKDFTGDLSSGSSKRESQLNLGEHGGVDVKVDAICRKDAVTPKQNLLQECNEEKSLKKSISDKTDQMERVSGRGRSLPLPPSGGSQSESLTRCPRPVTGFHRGNGPDTSQVDAVGGNDVLKVQKQIRKADDQNGSRHISSRHAMKNGHRARDLDTPSPVRRDSSSQAAVALKEARDLKRMADRFKNSGSNTERTGLYLQAALKFLHGASLLEPSNIETVKHNEMTQSTHIYSSTAKLCEFCAHEYEKSKDMAAAALAYKCVEVAYMRVVYSSHSIVSKDRQELQTALQMIPPGESPSSSASDVDNLNNPTTVDKVAIPKGVSSPQVAANHVISGKNRTNFVRMLNFTQDIHFAMEASRKSRIALAAANNANMGEAKHGEGISSIKKALDFNFQDIDGLLRLLRFAMEAISR